MYTLILAGGSGTRLWPLSRRETPKQFLKLFGDHTLLEDTVLRASEVSPPGSVHVVSGGDWRALVEHQARNVWPQGDLQVIAEPCGRNTAPAVALGLAWLLENGASHDDVVMVCPSDHVVADDKAFERAVQNAVKTAELGWITTFGVTPAGPETGYGYIRAARQESEISNRKSRFLSAGRRIRNDSEEQRSQGVIPTRSVSAVRNLGSVVDFESTSKLKKQNRDPSSASRRTRDDSKEQNLPLTDSPFSSLPPGAFAVECFVEKPDLDTAKSYIAEGCYFWNSGMFVFRICDMVAAMKRHVPEVGLALEKGFEYLSDNFETLPNISLDYAVMEKLKYAAVVPLDAGWSDVGAWDAVGDLTQKDSAGSCVIGDGMLLGGGNSLLYSRERLAVGIDLEDMIVVDSPDALLVAPKKSAQKVKDVVADITRKNRKEATQAPASARPWGTYKIVAEGPGFKIKRIVINPGKRLSLQYHHHRTEHWVVVQGTANVHLDGKVQQVGEGESVFVPRECPHRLENPGNMPVEIVEVQNGEYLGEDDIVRIEDDYKRT